MPAKKAKSQASIFEVGPRDGLQSEKAFFTIEERRQMVLSLVAAGLTDIEVGSFVREDRIPQLARTKELMQILRQETAHSSKRSDGPKFWAFVPNERGLEDALEAGVDGVSFFCAVSDTFARKNVNQSSSDLLIQAGVLIKKAKAARVKHRVYVSTLHHCPFEGEMTDEALLRIVKSLKKSGCDEFVFSDTTGHSTPERIERSLKKILKIIDKKKISMHLHDTRGLALLNIYVSMGFGVRRFDSSFGGLGGCPYAPGASGNLATEDLLYLLRAEKMISNKISMDALVEVSASVEKKLGRELSSKVYNAVRGERGTR